MTYEIKILAKGEWPKDTRTGGKWSSLAYDIDQLEIDGEEVMEVTFDSVRIAQAARTSLLGRAHRHARGWKYKLTVRDVKLYAQRVSVEVDDVG